MNVIDGEHLIGSVADALQLISYAHPTDFVRYLTAAFRSETSPNARAALEQILVSSRLSLFGRRPVCQDTGIVNVFVRLGLDVRIEHAGRSLQELIDEGVRRAYSDVTNPLRASIVADPLFTRRNTGDNTPAVVQVELVPGRTLEVSIVAKGAGSENKAQFTVLLPGADVTRWVVDTVAGLGSGWCPPGTIGVGVGGTVEKAMLLAKQALLEPLDMHDLLANGPQTPIERMRVRMYQEINALGIGAQGLGGDTTVLDVKVKTHPTHAASMPVALIPNCAATRHVQFALDGTGPAHFQMPDPTDWPELEIEGPRPDVKRVQLDRLTRDDVRSWKIGETLLLSGRLLTARDAAHRRLADLVARGASLPIDLKGRVVYYVGPVPPVGDEVVGPAGPTTAARLDSYLEVMLGHCGVFATIGKGERGEEALATIRRHEAASLVAVGGAAYLVSRTIRAARVVAFADLGMEAIREFDVLNFPVIVAVAASGHSIHTEGPAVWKEIRMSRRIGNAARAGPGQETSVSSEARMRPGDNCSKP